MRLEPLARARLLVGDDVVEDQVTVVVVVVGESGTGRTRSVRAVFAVLGMPGLPFFGQADLAGHGL